MSHEQEKPQQCGWITIGLILLLLQGILPGSILGGIAGLKSAGMMFGLHTGSDLLNRLFVLGGMITGLMVSAIAIMTLTLALSRTFCFFLKRRAPDSLDEKFGQQPEAGKQ